MTFAVRFLPEAIEQLASLYRYVAEASSPQVAADYVDAIQAHCEGLAVFPHRAHCGTTSAPGCGSPTSESASPSRSPSTTPTRP